MARTALFSVTISDDNGKLTMTLRRKSRILLETGVSLPALTAPAFTVAPAIIGTPVVGATLDFTRGAATGYPTPTVVYRWYLDGVAVGSDDTPYTVTAGDVGKSATVKQTATNALGVATSTSAAKTVVDVSARFGSINTDVLTHYKGHFTMINAMKVAYDGWAGGLATYADANGDLVGVPNSTSASSTLMNEFGTYFAKMKTGAWVLKWDGTATGITLQTGGLVSAGSSSANRFEFTMGQVPTGDGLTMQVTAPASGGPHSYTNFRLCPTAHEAALDAGEVWNPDYLALLPPTLQRARFMKGMNVEFTGGGDALAEMGTGGIVVESERTWVKLDSGGSSSITRAGIPYSAAAKFGAAVGCDIHVCVPYTASDAFMAAAAAQIAAVTAFTGLVYGEAGNEGWNSGYGRNWAWLQTYATAHGLADRAVAEAHIARRWWHALETALGRSRVKRAYCSQTFTSWATGSGSFPDLALASVDTGVIQAGQQLEDQVDVCMHAAYVTPESPPGGGVNQRFNCFLKNLSAATGTVSDAVWNDLLYRGTTAAATFVAAMYTAVKARRADIEIDSYEWGTQVQAAFGFAGTWYGNIVTGVSGHDVLRYTNADAEHTMAHRTGDHIKDFGDALDSNSIGLVDGVPPNTNPQYWVKVRNSTDVWIYDSLATMAADTGDTGVGSLALNGTQPTYQFGVDNYDSLQRFSDSIKAYLDGAPGLALYQELWATTVGTGKSLTGCHLSYLGGYTLSEQFGLKSGIYADDTPRFTWFKALTGA